MAKQARILDDRRMKQALQAVRTPHERAMLLASCRAGLRAVEIAGLIWRQVDFEAGELLLTTTKGKKPRSVPMARDLAEALRDLKAAQGDKAHSDRPVFPNRHAQPGAPLTANAVAVWFHTFYGQRLGWEGFSSHSGRRSFCTRIARNIVQAGGSLRDVQDLMGHESLATTQVYIEVNPDAKRKVVEIA